MEPRTWQLAAVGLGLGALAGCASSNGPNLPPCAGPVTLAATSALEPSFAWTPNCLVDQLTLEEDIAPSAGGPQPRWAMRSRVTGHGIPGPLRYGDVPASMEELLSPATLVAGREYSARVFAGTVVVGQAVFRP